MQLALLLAVGVLATFFVFNKLQESQRAVEFKRQYGLRYTREIDQCKKLLVGSFTPDREDIYWGKTASETASSQQFWQDRLNICANNRMLETELTDLEKTKEVEQVIKNNEEKFRRDCAQQARILSAISGNYEQEMRICMERGGYSYNGN